MEGCFKQSMLADQKYLNKELVHDQIPFLRLQSSAMNFCGSTLKPTRLVSSQAKDRDPAQPIQETNKLKLKSSFPCKSRADSKPEVKLPQIESSKTPISNTFKSVSPIRPKLNTAEIPKTPEISRNLCDKEYYQNLFETYRLLNEKTRQKILISQMPTPVKNNRMKTIIPHNENFLLNSNKFDEVVLTDSQKFGPPKKTKFHAIHSSLMPSKHKFSNSNLMFEKFQTVGVSKVSSCKNESANFSTQNAKNNIVHEFNKCLDSATKDPIGLHHHSKSIGEISDIEQSLQQISQGGIDTKNNQLGKKVKGKLFCCF